MYAAMPICAPLYCAIVFFHLLPAHIIDNTPLSCKRAPLYCTFLFLLSPVVFYYRQSILVCTIGESLTDV